MDQHSLSDLVSHSMAQCVRTAIVRIKPDLSVALRAWAASPHCSAGADAFASPTPHTFPN